MTEKENFIKEWDKQFPTKTAQSFVESKDFAGFAKRLSDNPKLKALFREAVEETTDPEASAAAGLDNLFVGCE